MKSSQDRGNAKLKFIDRWLGPVLLFFVSLVRGSGKLPKNPETIGLIKAAAIGDTVLLSALISDLRLSYPRSKIHLFVGRSNSSFSKLLKEVDQVHELPIRSLWKAIQVLRKTRCDLLIDADSWPRLSAIWCAFAGAAWTVGFRTRHQHRHFCFDQRVDHRSDIHEIENYRNLLRAIGLSAQSPVQNFSWIGKDKALANCVALHLWPGGTQSHLKEWPAKNWKALIESLASQSDLNFILTGGPENQDSNHQFIQSLTPDLQKRVLNKAGVSFQETIQILRSVSFLISVNTGILHLGAAVETPVLGLHGPTNPLRWGPVGDKHVSVISAHPRAGQLNLGFEYEDSDQIMVELSFEEVLRGAQELSDRNLLHLKFIQ